MNSRDEKSVVLKYNDSVASERQLDNLDDLISITSGNSKIMSWPGDERLGDFDHRRSQSPFMPGSSHPPHHPNALKKRKSKKGSRQSKEEVWNIDVTEGRSVSDSEKWDKEIDPLPVPQTDVPVFSLSSRPDTPPKYHSIQSYESTLSTDTISEGPAGQQKEPKHKRHHRDKKKRKHQVRPEESPSLLIHSAELPVDPPPSSFVLYNGETVPTRPDQSTIKEALKLVDFPDARVDAEHHISASDNNVRLRKDSASSTGELDESMGRGAIRKREKVEALVLKAQSRQLGTAIKHTDSLMDREHISQFIVENIEQRECCRYVADTMKTERHNTCVCGRPLLWHVERKLEIEKNSKLGHQKTNTKTYHCDSFGEIHFSGFGPNVYNSPYARVDFKTSPSVVWELLIDYWKMPRPRLLISVTGGAKRFELKPRLSALLKQGIVEAAVNTGAWIITGGTATGVMEFVGEAVRDHITVAGRSQDVQCVALGIATWGCVSNNLALDGEGDSGLWPAEYAVEDINNSPPGYSSLDPNHTHFLLVDNGQEGQFGAEISFRSELEYFISAVGTTGVSESQVIHTPVVLIVVEGGVGTMETVYQSAKLETPVVVIKGSGRAADFIALAHKLTEKRSDPDTTIYPPNFEDTMKEAASNLFVWKANERNKDQKIQKCIDQLKGCLKTRSLINVFNLESSDSAKDIDRAILYALLKANKFNCKSQLALALAWNRCDIARQKIFIPENRRHWELKDLYDAMFTALVQNRTDFVQLFLDNGVDLKKFLTTKTLWNLYCNCLNVQDDGEANILRHMIMTVKQGWGAYLRCQALEEWEHVDKYDILYCINKVIIHLLKNEGFAFYAKRTYEVSNEKANMEWKGNVEALQPLISRISSQSQTLTAKTQQPGNGGQKYRQSEDDTEVDDLGQTGTKITSRPTKQQLKRMEHFDFKHPERDLFIFAVLFNRRKMADLFLRCGIDHIGTSLLGAALLKALSDQADLEEETSISQDLNNHSQMLEHFAVSVLNQCYQRNKTDCHLVLTRKIRHLGNMTPLLLADEQQLMDFAEHSACQTRLTAIWKGSLTVHTSEFKVLLTIFLPFLIFFMKFDKADKSKLFDNMKKNQTNNEPAKPNDDLIKNTTPRFAPSVPRIQDRTKRTNFKEVRVFTCGGEAGVGVFRAFYKFYKAPVTKFYANIVAYLVFLALFSYFALTNVRPVGETDSPSAVEYIVWLWFLTMMMEEVRQVMIRDQRSIRYKIRNWWSNFWNQFDFCMYTFVIISIILRYQLEKEDFVYVRVMYSITLVMSYLRFMQFFFAEKNMGPKVIMIRRMLTDLMFFFLILLVFVLSFGVAYHINMFPNAPVSWSILYNVLHFPYFQIYGELFLEDLSGDEVNGCTRNETIWREDPMKRCPEENVIVLVLLAVYMILTNILLVNLLIAMFSYTFQTVQDMSTKVWRFYRISLVYEYFDRPSMVPPVIIINHIWRIVRYLIAIKSGKIKKRHNVFALYLSDEDNLRLSLFEKAAMEVHLAHSSLQEREQLDKRVASTSDRLEMVMDDLQKIKEAVRQQEASAAPTNLPSDVAKTSADTSQDATIADSPITEIKKFGAWAENRRQDEDVQTQLKQLQQQTLENNERLAQVASLLDKIAKQHQ